MNVKKYAIVTGAVVVAVAATSASVVKYQHYQNTQRQETQAVSKVKLDEVAQTKATAKVDHDGLVKAYNTLRVECEKGQAAHALLPVSLRTKTPLPNCGAVLTQ